MSNDTSAHCKTARTALVVGLLGAVGWGCGPTTIAPPPAPGSAELATPVSEESASEPIPEPAPEPRATRGEIQLHTSEGPITVGFFPDIAPRTVAHVSALLAAGCYDGRELFRLEPGFVIQVEAVPDNGCHPDTASTVPAEFSEVKHERLMLSLARWEDPDSGTSSWTIMLGASPAMDGQYTIFGRVVAGEETIAAIEAIGAVPGERGMNKPARSVKIERVEVLQPVAADPPDVPEGPEPVPVPASASGS